MNYEEILSERVRTIAPSGIRRFFDLASEIEGVISLGVGEPDFSTPWHICDAAIYSIENGKTHYTANQGLFELRREICNYINRKLGITYDPKTEPATLKVDAEKAKKWLSNGAQPTDTVRALLKKVEVL